MKPKPRPAITAPALPQPHKTKPSFLALLLAELPLRRPEKMRWDETWSIVVAKNNAKALVVPPEGAEDGAAVCR